MSDKPMNPAIPPELLGDVRKVALKPTLTEKLNTKVAAPPPPGCTGRKATCTRTEAPRCRACTAI